MSTPWHIQRMAALDAEPARPVRAVQRPGGRHRRGAASAANIIWEKKGRRCRECNKAKHKAKYYADPEAAREAQRRRRAARKAAA